MPMLLADSEAEAAWRFALPCSDVCWGAKEAKMTKDVYKLSEERARGGAAGKRYTEFLRVPALSCGVYVLAVGAEDRQSPHGEDEIYYVVRGRARLRVTDAGGTREHSVGPGDVLFVAAHVEHKFFEVGEDIELLVFFAPAETG
jgi:mannose-6-phosphate isomerase-like protein (cupin superfamily)